MKAVAWCSSVSIRIEKEWESNENGHGKWKRKCEWIPPFHFLSLAPHSGDSRLQIGDNCRHSARGPSSIPSLVVFTPLCFCCTFLVSTCSPHSCLFCLPQFISFCWTLLHHLSHSSMISFLYFSFFLFLSTTFSFPSVFVGFRGLNLVRGGVCNKAPVTFQTQTHLFVLVSNCSIFSFRDFSFPFFSLSFLFLLLFSLYLFSSFFKSSFPFFC